MAQYFKQRSHSQTRLWWKILLLVSSWVFFRLWDVFLHYCSILIKKCLQKHLWWWTCSGHLAGEARLTARYCGVSVPRPARFPQVEALLSCWICCTSCCCRRRCSLSLCVSANFTTRGEEQPWSGRAQVRGFRPSRGETRRNSKVCLTDGRKWLPWGLL